jgi:LAO/AO transport system kinase
LYVISEKFLIFHINTTSHMLPFNPTFSDTTLGIIPCITIIFNILAAEKEERYSLFLKAINMARARNWKELFEGIVAGDRVRLGMAFSLIESKRPSDQREANMLVNACVKKGSKDSLRLGITGSPGVGKSSVIEKIGLEAISRGQKVAVLAVDPSSSISGGSILGDKTRMHQLSSSADAFIRPSAAGKTLGGVARTTREAIAICEAAGYDLVIVETVGVGQSETAVYHMTDMFVFLVLPGAGDELQGIKRGIVEMADLVVVNKADGEREKLAGDSARDYSNALHMLAPKTSGWTAAVLKHSINKPETTPTLVDKINAFKSFIEENGQKQIRRSKQQAGWFDELLKAALLDRVNKLLSAGDAGIESAKKEVAEFRTSPAMAVGKIMDRMEFRLKEYDK